MADRSKDTTDIFPFVLNQLEDAFPEQDCGHEGYMQRLWHYREEINNFLDNREKLVDDARVLAQRQPGLSSDNVLSGGNCQSLENISDADLQSTHAIPVNSEPRKLTAQFKKNIKAHSHCYVAGMALLMEKYLLVCDTENKMVKVVDLNETKDECIVAVTFLPSSPRGVACLFGGYIAVTLPKDKQINIFKYQNNSLQYETKFGIEHDCHGIDYLDDRILVTYVTPAGFGVYNVNYTPTLKCTNHFKSYTTDYLDTTEIPLRPLYIKGLKLQSDAKFIVVSDEMSGYVTVHSWEDGSLIQKLDKDPRFVQPRGLTLYNADHLLVAFRDTNNVVLYKINEHGHLCFDCIVLDENSYRDFCQPCALLFSTEKQVLYLSCQHIEGSYELKNNIQVYEIS